MAIEIAAASNHLGENMAGRSAFVAAIVLLAVFEFSADVQAQQSQGQKNPVAPVLSHPVIKEPPTQPTGGKPKTGAAGVIPKPGLAYTFTLNFFKITDTRSLHSDTDFVSISVAVGSKPPINPAPKSVGDLNNGTYQVNMSIPDITAADTDAVAFTYAIVNSGHDKNDMETQLRSALGSAARRAAQGAASAAGYINAGNLGSVIGLYVGPMGGRWLFNEISGVVFANCDGIVAAGSHVYSGAQLNHQLADGHVITATDDNKGTNFPTGCGGNSRYYVTWTISGHPKAPPAIGR